MDLKRYLPKKKGDAKIYNQQKKAVRKVMRLWGRDNDDELNFNRHIFNNSESAVK